jgi:UDP-3-O-[3-hydroxymyristoyl] glucosamine N-acyltransferase
MVSSYFYKKVAMRLEIPQTLEEIATFLGCRFIGDPNHLVSGINEIHMVIPGDLVFVDHPKYYEKALKSAATTVLIDQEVDCPVGKGLLISATPFDDFNRLTRHFRPTVAMYKSIGDHCSIHESAHIAPNVTIGNHVKIGANVVLHPGVVIHDHCIIDEESIIGPNTVIGYNAFYYKKKSSGYDRMHTCGSVHIHPRVEIGASCTIDAGVTGVTTVGEGTKIDNQVHVGHDTVIGKHCLFAAHVGIAGCVRIRDHVTLWGQVGLASDITVGEGVVLFAQSGASKDLDPGKTYFGSPCGEAKEKFRELAAMRQLPQMIRKMR